MTKQERYVAYAAAAIPKSESGEAASVQRIEADAVHAHMLAEKMLEFEPAWLRTDDEGVR